MTGHAPDFCMLMIGSNAGVIGMTKGEGGLVDMFTKMCHTPYIHLHIRTLVHSEHIASQHV